MKRTALLPLFALAMAPLVGCVDEGTTADDANLTSVQARSRELKFEGRVYVEPGTDDTQILYQVHRQTKTAFGPLRTSDVAVNNRELLGVDPLTFVKREVEVVDTTDPSATPKAMVEVTYTYVDDAVVPSRMATRSSLAGAVLRPDYQGESDRILKECTPNDKHSQDFASALWYVFEPSLSSCGKAITAESDVIVAARAELTDAATQVPLVEVERLYLPVTFALGADKTNDGKSYPEYDRLYSGGVKPGKLVISVLNGLIDHDASGKLNEDSGYGEWLDTLDEIIEARPGFRVVDVEGGVDITKYTLASGKSVTLDLPGIIDLHQGSGPSDLSYTEERELDTLVAERVADRWITLEVQATVKIGTKKTKPVAIQILAYFGHAESTPPFKFAIKNSDVFLYNGHSMIGSGPLDPRNFSSSDFPSTYQILFIDGCVSYNYYEADYIPLKTGGTKNLDLITNAIESPSYRSGYALGRFVATLIDGSSASYLDLLESAEATGSGLRVVDGELDNTYDPAKKAIKLTVK